MTNGINGGLVLGNSHDDGGIEFYDENSKPIGDKVIEVPPNIKIVIPDTMQGGEFLINPIASVIYKDRIIEINESVKDNGDTHKNMFSSAKRVIDCRDINRIIVRCGQYVVNRQATIENLEELEEINEYGQDRLK